LGALLHDSHHEEHQLEDQDQDDQQFERFAARHASLLDREAIDRIERVQLLANVLFPLIEADRAAVSVRTRAV
jgi:hypothetical protein